MPPEFRATQSFGNFAAFDDYARRMLLISCGESVPYDDILGYEYIEEQGSMGRGGVARAFSVVPSGEYVATAMKIRLLIAGDPPRELFIPLLITPTKSGNFIFRSLKGSADAILKKLGEIRPRRSESSAGGGPDYTEEIRRLDRLRDEGILTEEEFRAKKKQLLGI
ncbi:MAG TPA: SHOCT domain-containing protein [Feifaniaceae bacterium]|nr:SHOCT domain-containing protein [Feifaniaceae bacterium]